MRLSSIKTDHYLGDVEPPPPPPLPSGLGWRSDIVWVEKTTGVDGRTHRMNAEVYRNRCLWKVGPELKKHKSFMFDGARCHVASTCKQYLDNKGISYINDWPAHSPDLNPIEQLWRLLDELVAGYPPSSKQCGAEATSEKSLVGHSAINH